MSAKEHLVLSENDMRVQKNLHEIIVNQLVNKNAVCCHTCRFKGAMANLSSLQGYKFRFDFKGCFGVPHRELYYFWGWKTSSVLFSCVCSIFHVPVISSVHPISLL